MSSASRLWPGRVRAAFPDNQVDEGFGPISVDVPVGQWSDAVRLARDGLDCRFFDFLTAVDEWRADAGDDDDDGFRIVCHLVAHQRHDVQHLLLRTLVGRGSPLVPSIADIFAGARWHERETHEMFGVEFTVDGEVLELAGLLLPEEFVGHPLRKEFVLASRVAKPWPGAKDPGESDSSARAAPARRRMRPPGVPEPEEWGPRDG
ncbi:MAG: NADH-quinone oxidoreductase subunit C [Nocardioidaceae bacterium]